MAVAFEELAGSPTESWGANGMKAERRFLVAWDDRYSFIIEMLGTGNLFGDQKGAAYPGVGGVTAVGAKCKPWTDDMVSQSMASHTTQIQDYTSKAHVTVNYEYADEDWPEDNDLPDPRPDDADDHTYLTYRADFSTEMMVFKGTDLLKKSNAVMPEGHSVEFVKRIPIVTFQITWHRVVRPPWAAIYANIGKINQNAFLGADAGTFLFEGVSTEREWATRNGNELIRYWSMTYTFSEKRIDIDGAGTIRGWNWIFDSHPLADAAWKEITLKDGENPYQGADFAPLFRQ